MKLKQSIYYQLWDYRNAILFYYGVVVALHLLMFLAFVIHGGHGAVYLSGGISAFTGLFLFICGMCCLHEILPMSLQNGVSRKTMFLARLAVTGIVAAGMAVVDTFLCLAVDVSTLGRLFWADDTSSLFLSVFGLAHSGFEDTAVATLLSIPYNFCLFVLVSALGYFLIVFFYRMPLRLRIVVAVCLVATIGPGQLLIKMVDALLLHNFLADWFAPQLVYPVMDVIESNPFLNMGVWLLSAAALSGLTWLLLRKTVVRR